MADYWPNSPVVCVAVLFRAFHEVSGVAGESSRHDPRAVHKTSRGSIGHVLVEFYFLSRPVAFSLIGWDLGW